MATASGASRDELAAYLALAQLPGIGAVRLGTLTAAFQSAAAALQAPHGAIAALPGFGRAAATAVRAVSLDAGREQLTQLDRLGATVLLPDDPRFPQALRDIPEPPALLYAWGNVALFQRPAAGVVGSRNHSSYGATAARLLAAGVAQAGVVIVSGMARGIDAIAHTAALDAGGASLGVLGNGFGVVYPAANRPLYERMITHGCLVTELPPGERPRAHTFPRRNRLISEAGAVRRGHSRGAGSTGSHPRGSVNRNPSGPPRPGPAAAHAVGRAGRRAAARGRAGRAGRSRDECGADGAHGAGNARPGEAAAGDEVWERLIADCGLWIVDLTPVHRIRNPKSAIRN